MRTLKTILILLSLFGIQASAHDLERDASSSIWQVRYCLTGRFAVADSTARRLLEKLSLDSHSGVASQAFAHYSGLFLDLDQQVVLAAFRRGEFDLVGINMKDRKAFETPGFWALNLRRVEAPDLQARAIRALGLCGSQENLSLLQEYRNSDNPYLLHELAKALHRLGDEAGYLNVIEAILRLPPASAVHYQTLAIDCLIQSHPAKARESWNKLHAAIASMPDLQPNWMCGHIFQEERLP
ncbi:HEAT repeat domain-containing protein [Prosthecobacter vanneervenii]|uniref:HEAT repeat protein n=1 Tax=Prosthecobacter vanneervenii TaxID=48466 RepID=A0A7W7Y6N2_9BACT|nr:HEAT repeat domain-containing protein [Prosthecobacter vanneervenii]MBB5030577.1 HEAT repeat protein [Prosthecobacter vanneervenii]